MFKLRFKFRVRYWLCCTGTDNSLPGNLYRRFDAASIDGWLPTFRKKGSWTTKILKVEADSSSDTLVTLSIHTASRLGRTESLSTPL